jgi:hypothetical protein
MMYCNDASLRIVTKSLYGTPPPFSILISIMIVAMHGEIWKQRQKVVVV